jgi:hypothetical protein
MKNEQSRFGGRTPPASIQQDGELLSAIASRTDVPTQMLSGQLLPRITLLGGRSDLRVNPRLARV